MNDNIVSPTTDLAMQLLREGKAEECIACLDRLLVTDPDAALAYSILGAAYTKLGDRGMAIGAFERALAEEPTPRAHFNLGRAYEHAGRERDALEQFRQAANMDPGYKPAADALQHIGVSVTEIVPPAAHTRDSSSVSADEPATAAQPVPPKIKTREEREAEQEIEIRRVQKAMTKSGLIYGMIVGPVGLMGAMFILRIFMFMPLGLLSALIFGVVLGAIVGLWIGYSSGDESSGAKTGALAGSAILTGMALIHLSDGGVGGVVISAISGALIGAVSGYFIGMMVSNSIGWN